MKLTEEQLARFMTKIDKDPDTGCWNWTGYISPNGCPRAAINQKTYHAHRVSAMHFKDFDLESNLYIRRTCNNQVCVNPDHLFISGSQGRPTLRALTRCQVNEIKFWWHQAESKKSQEALARMYGVSQKTIQRIVTGKTYQDHPLYVYA